MYDGEQEGMCLILGRCYEVNDTRSDSDICWKCLPENSLSAWSWGMYTAYILNFYVIKYSMPLVTVHWLATPTRHA